MTPLEAKLASLRVLHERERLDKQYAERKVLTHAKAMAVLRTKIDALQERIDREKQQESH